MNTDTKPHPKQPERTVPVHCQRCRRKREFYVGKDVIVTAYICRTCLRK